MAKQKTNRFPRKQFASMSYNDIKALNRSEAQTLLAMARKEYQKQAESFERNRKTVYSHAYELTKNYYKYKRLKPPSKTKVSDAKSELEHLRKFFEADSSTIKGAKQIIREQSARIFGTYDDGKNRYTMSAAQAAEFWATYLEYRSMNPGDTTKDSNRIQEIIGAFVMKTSEFKKNRRADDFYFTASDFNRIHDKFEELQKILSLEKWEDAYVKWKRDLFSGTPWADDE